MSLEEFYELNFKVKLKRFVRWKKLVKICGFFIFFLSLCPGLKMISNSGINEKSVTILLFIGSLGLTSAWVIYISYLHYNKKSFRKNIVEPLINFANLENILYDPNQHIKQLTVNFSRLFHGEQVTGSDYVIGSKNQILFEFSKIMIETASSHKKTKQTTFEGLFFTAEFNKKVKSETLIFPDNAEKKLGGVVGNFLQRLNYVGIYNLVKLENPIFEKYFCVYSNNVTDAFYVLSPNIMEKMVLIREKFNRNVYFSIIDSRICVAVKGANTFFDIPNKADFSYVENFLKQLSLIINLVTDLNLSTTIWTK